jgi:C1A family cysteine protease
MLKRLFFVALATLNIAMTTGCGTTALPVAATGMERTAASQATVFVAGKQRKLGYDLNRYMKQQAPKARLRQMPPTQGLMPAKIDLRAKCSPVVDQLDIGSCTSFAVGKGLREYLQVKNGERKVALSPLFLYFETRKLRGTTNIDSGATITDAMTALSTAGIAPESTWSYMPELFDQKPPAAAYKAAPEFKCTTGVQLAGLEDVKKALAKGQPVAFGMKVYNTFRDIGKTGKMELPQNGDILVGGHAVCAVGYDNKRQALIVRNSWGSEWGDGGYFYMPYGYVTPDNVMDMWTAN